ncbi:unnamed protein product [Acanthoscelides obtectus]|uniref:Uncharacterized protein n=1 Tax=Acanthoscelides obtectus TaxID=200917 RepID=A0A9P0PYI2_ACAOB|nr:unnamed protein product [Acanthoscelides obtectus]CAK1643301.1 hypothetical protein AOBTE_LOCUS13486 [Acanthoscelides obtectus]
MATSRPSSSKRINVLDPNFEEIAMRWFNEVDNENSDIEPDENVFIESEHESTSEQEASDDDPDYEIEHDEDMDISSGEDDATIGSEQVLEPNRSGNERKRENKYLFLNTVRTYKKKTARGIIPIEQYESAMQAILQEKLSIRDAATRYGKNLSATEIGHLASCECHGANVKTTVGPTYLATSQQRVRVNKVYCPFAFCYEHVYPISRELSLTPPQVIFSPSFQLMLILFGDIGDEIPKLPPPAHQSFYPEKFLNINPELLLPNTLSSRLLPVHACPDLLNIYYELTESRLRNGICHMLEKCHAKFSKRKSTST